jgi:hypothetical protein
LKVRYVLYSLFILLACGLAAVLLRYVFLGTPIVTYRDELVSAGQVSRLTDVINVHSGRERFIRVGKKTYRRVRGSPPFYLPLPQLQSIIFVTESANGAAELHIFGTGDGKEVKIHANKLYFGNNIGGQKIPGSAYSDYVEKESPTELVLATSYPRLKISIHIDLKAGKIAKVQEEECDADGRGIAQHVYEGQQLRDLLAR